MCVICALGVDLELDGSSMVRPSGVADASFRSSFQMGDLCPRCRSENSGTSSLAVVEPVFQIFISVGLAHRGDVL